MSTEDIAAVVGRVRGCVDVARKGQKGVTRVYVTDAEALCTAAERVANADELVLLNCDAAREYAAERDALRTSLTAAQNELARVDAEVAPLRAALTAAQRELDDSERRRQVAEDRRVDLADKLAERDSQYGALRSRVQALEGTLLRISQRGFNSLDDLFAAAEAAIAAQEGR